MKHKCLTLAAILFILTFCISSMTGCIVIHNGGSYDYADRYDNASKYITADGSASVEGTVKRLYIYWVSGDVTVETHSRNDFLLSEDSTSELSENLRMRYFLDGETLYVRFAASGSFRMNILGKSLTLKVPDNIEFDEIRISTTSANIKVSEICADEFDFNTVSGSIGFSGISAAESLSIDIISGKVDGAAVGKINSVDVNTVSGNVSLSLDAPEKIEIDTTSDSIEISTSSCPSEIDLDSVSGALTLRLPSDSGFDAKLSSISGSITSDFPTQVSGSHYIYGDGTMKISAESISGNIYIRKNS